MSYIKNVWANGDKVTAKKLNNIENGIEELDNKTKIVDKEFKEFELGQTFNVGYKLSKDNVQNINVGTLEYSFYDETETYAYFIYWNVEKQLFSWSLVRVENDEILDSDYSELFTFGLSLDDTSLTFKLEDVVDEGHGNGLLGTWTDKQLTSQEVYDNTKLKDEVIQVGINLEGLNNIDRSVMKRGLYQIEIGAPDFLNYYSVFYWNDKIEIPICVPILIEDSNNELQNAFMQFELHPEYINEVLVSVVDNIGDTIQIELGNIITLTRIL